MDKSAEQFWAEFEAETGEKVEARSIGTYLDPEARGEGPWGLLVLTDASLRFKHMPSRNWVQSLFKSHDTSPSAPAPDIVVPRADVISVSIPKRGLLARFLGPVFPPFALTWREGDSLRRASFAADPGSELLARLAAAFPASPPGP